jgi:hypothetical protein
VLNYQTIGAMKALHEWLVICYERVWIWVEIGAVVLRVLSKPLRGLPSVWVFNTVWIHAGIEVGFNTC